MNLRKLVLPVVLVTMVAVSQSGCSAQKPIVPNENAQPPKQVEKEPGVNSEAEQKASMAKFASMVESTTDVREIKKYVDGNIAKVSKERASQMTIGLEKAQKNYLPKLEDKYYGVGIQQKFGAGIQQKLAEVYKPKFDLTDLGGIQNQQLKQLLEESRDGGYKVETAEGSYFPVINYEVYKQYQDRVTADIKEYINIMAVESNNPPAKDAAIIIAWDEVLNRAINQEKFIKQYPDSAKITDVKQQFKRYISFTLYGANNTPLFDYDTKTLVPEAKAKYVQVVQGSVKSEFVDAVREYLNIVEKNNNKLTNEVINYRKQLEEKLH